MSTFNPEPITVLHDGEVAAVCTSTRVHFAPRIEVLPVDHPVRVHVAAKCLVAGAILRGEACGPYDDLEATETAYLLAGMAPVRAAGRRERPGCCGRPRGAVR